MEFKGWGTDYTQCRYQGSSDTEASNLINDLYKMVPDAQNNMLIGIKQERTRNVANQNYGKPMVQQRGQFADMNWVVGCNDRRTGERTLQTGRSSGLIQT